jgi:glycosyltransferase involved in cell wall biosynthesis
LKFVSILWPSNYPNFESDSIFVFNRILLRRMAEQPNIEITVLGPIGLPPLVEGLQHYLIDLGCNKFSVRFGFPWLEMRNALFELQPDVIFVNMPEQAASLRILLRDELGLETLVVTYVHYIPGMVAYDLSSHPSVVVESGMDRSGNGKLVLTRLLECLCASDLVLTCSDFGRSTLMIMASQLLGPDQVYSPIKVLPPPLEFAEIDSLSISKTVHERRLVYNHRLYDEYGTHEVFGLLDELYDEVDAPFRVLVTNPTGIRTPEREALNPQVTNNVRMLANKHYVDLQYFNQRCDYYLALNSCVGGIAPFKPNALWSMSIVDVLAVGKPVVAFNIASFAEIGITRPDLVDDRQAFKERLFELLRQDGDSDVIRACELRDLARNYCSERIACTFYSLLAEI